MKRVIYLFIWIYQPATNETRRHNITRKYWRTKWALRDDSLLETVYLRFGKTVVYSVAVVKYRVNSWLTVVALTIWPNIDSSGTKNHHVSGHTSFAGCDNTVTEINPVRGEDKGGLRGLSPQAANLAPLQTPPTNKYILTIGYIQKRYD